MASAAVQLDHRVAPHRAAPRLRVVRGGAIRSTAPVRWRARRPSCSLWRWCWALSRPLSPARPRLTELTGEIDAKHADLAEAQTTYDYLTSQMDEIANMSNLGTVAEKQLGLVKTDPSQITYLRIESEGVIERSESQTGKALEDLRTAALSLLDSFDPVTRALRRALRRKRPESVHPARGTLFLLYGGLPPGRNILNTPGKAQTMNQDKTPHPRERRAENSRHPITTRCACARCCWWRCSSCSAWGC